MDAFPANARPFFADKARAFWTLQAVGWAGYLVLRAVSGFSSGQPLEFLLPLLVHTVTGYSLTLLLAVVYDIVHDQRRAISWTLSGLSIAGATFLYATVDSWVFATLERPVEGLTTRLIFTALFIDLMVIGAWTALYYAINFYLTIEDQLDQLQSLENEASSAQLAMLRYQLNPHFLFNTLNSISTLVLLKQTDRANTMLTRLSSFLRYTLADEPTAQVTLAQEFETLKLYLDIEKMRFEDRLRPCFTIDAGAARARLPSLLLQPLVENAIKYAVSTQENGADIAIDARLAGERVRITVSDTGPGLNGAAHRPSVSTGVGLANIRDRLAQAFGPDHRFDAGTNPEGGFGVVIEFPLQIDEQPRVAA